MVLALLAFLFLFQDTGKVDPKLHADVVKFVELSGEREKMQSGLAGQLAAAKFRMMTEECKGCDPAFGDEWVKRMTARTKVDEYMHVIERAYETHFGDDDILGMTALLNQSKSGQKPTPSDDLRKKLMGTMPAVQNEIARGSAQIGAKLGPEVRKELEKEHALAIKLVPLSAGTARTAIAAFTRRHWAGFVHHHGSAHQILAVAGVDGLLGHGVIVDFHESESARLACKTIAHDGHRIDSHTIVREKTLDIGLIGSVGKVAHK
jgi:hypothetical protein